MLEMSIGPTSNPGEPGIADVPEAAPAPPAVLNPYDPAKAWVFGSVIGILVAGRLGSISQYLAVAPILVLSLLIVRRRRLKITDVYRLRRPRIADLKFPIAFSVSIGCAEMLVFEGINYLTNGGVARAVELLSGEAVENPLLVEILFVVAVAPLLEELFFRGFFMSSLASMGPGWAVMLPSLFFAFAHNPLKWPTTLVGAVALSVFVLETGSIAAGVAGHVTNNLLGMLLPVIHDVLPGDAGEFACLIFLMTGAATGLLFTRQYKVLWLRFREYRADFRREPGVIGGARYLLKRWPYWAALILFVATICLYGVVIATGAPIEVG